MRWLVTRHVVIFMLFPKLMSTAHQELLTIPWKAKLPAACSMVAVSHNEYVKQLLYWHTLALSPAEQETPAMVQGAPAAAAASPLVQTADVCCSREAKDRRRITLHQRPDPFFIFSGGVQGG